MNIKYNKPLTLYRALQESFLFDSIYEPNYGQHFYYSDIHFQMFRLRVQLRDLIVE